MKLCGPGCYPCCDFCAFAVHERWFAEDGHLIRGGPIDCLRHHDQEHREIAKWCGSCEDFYCFRAERGE